jgi:beta-lactamase class A
MNSSISRIFFWVFFVLLMVIPANARHPYPPLSHSGDPVLQEGLEQCITDLNLQGAVHKKSLCVALVDISDPHAPRLAAINGNEMMYAASLPKIAVLLGAFQRCAQGQMEMNEETRDTLTCMIRNSSNSAATEMLRKVGKEYLTELLQSSRYRLYDPAQNGGLWVGKEYGKSPAWRRDPLHNLSHGATALQVARFYYLLETGRLVSPEMSMEMKEILGDPAIQHKFVKGLNECRPGSDIYRKSGTWRDYHSDSALVERDGRRYIAVALAKDPQGGEWLSRLIVSLDDLIFQCPPSPPRYSWMRDKTE